MAYTSEIGAKYSTVKQMRKMGSLLMEQGGGGSGISDAPVNGEAYVRVDESWRALNNLTQTVNVGIEDAPNDGNVYVRTDGGWETGLPTSVVVGITDAPSDNNVYVRVNGAWQLVDNTLSNA